MPLILDHLVIGAATLDEGAAYVRARLGIDMPSGGAHPLMGTHNRLLRIGEASFLEIIAIDPQAPAPGRQRWFALDHDDQRRRLAEAPRLIGWVAGTRYLDGLLAEAPELGRAIIARRGDLAWRIGIRDDGALAEGGTLPVPIEWPEGPHPADRMADLGVRLERLRLLHPDPAALAAMLERIGASALAEIAPADNPGLEARLRLADGRIALLSS